MTPIPSGEMAILTPPEKGGLYLPPGVSKPAPAPPQSMVWVRAPETTSEFKPLTNWMSMAHFQTPLTNAASMLRFNVADIDHHWYEWNYNTIHNVNLQLPALHQLYSRPSPKDAGPNKDKTCLIVAAGPSAKDEQNLMKLKKEKEAGLFDYIICVDRQFKTLKSFGIDPDLIITEDASDRVYDFLFSGDPMPDKEKTKLAFCAFAGHRAARTAKEMGYDTYLYASANPVSPFWLTFYTVWGKEYVSSRCGVIVTFSALDAAYWMGYGNIVALGNDLCYRDPFSAMKDCPSGFSVMAMEDTQTYHFTIEAFRLAFDQMQGYADVQNRESGTRFIDCTIDYAPPKKGWEQAKFTKIRSALSKTKLSEVQ